MNNTNKVIIDEIAGRYGDYWIYTCPDVGDNIGGYYVEIYTDEDRNGRYDYFCISPEQLKINSDKSFWIKEYLGLNKEATQNDYIPN